MLLRRLARPLLASIFIYGGVQELRNVSAHAPAVSHLVEQTAGQVDETLPDQLPTDVETLARVDGAVKVGAGALLALGKFPRLTSLLLAANTVPTTLAAHAFWEHADEQERGSQAIHFLKNVGIIGGLLASATDTGGKHGKTHRCCPRKKAANAELSAKAATASTGKNGKLSKTGKPDKSGKASKNGTGACGKKAGKAAAKDAKKTKQKA